VNAIQSNLLPWLAGRTGATLLAASRSPG